MAPSPETRPRRCSALDPDTWNVMGSDPPVWNSTSPEWKYQSNTSATPSLRSATKPSSDMDMIATTFDIAMFLSARVACGAFDLVQQGSDVLRGPPRPARHHTAHPCRVPDVLERIPFDQDELRPHPGRDRAPFRVPEVSVGSPRRGEEGRMVREPGRDERLELTVEREARDHEDLRRVGAREERTAGPVELAHDAVAEADEAAAILEGHLAARETGDLLRPPGHRRPRRVLHLGQHRERVHA